MKHIRKLIKSIMPLPQYKEALLQLKMLAKRDALNQSTPDDLRDWENNLKILRNSHPFWEVKLLEDNLIEAFPLYLEKHYPHDERLAKLKKYEIERRKRELNEVPRFYD